MIFPIIQIADTHPLCNPDCFEKFLARVSSSRRDYALHYKFPKDRALSLGAALLLESGMHDLGIDTTNLNTLLYKNPFGKLYLKDSSLYFNLSHSEYRAMAIFSPSECGCDIEFIRPLTDQDTSLAETLFSKNELDFLHQTNPSRHPEIFYRIWTARESLLKTIGCGLSDPIPDFSVISDDGFFLPLITLRERTFYGESSIIEDYTCAWWMEVPA